MLYCTVLSVVVPTRNRPDQVVPCAEAILAAPGVGEVLFVDQSDSTSAQAALQAIPDPRLRCLRSEQRGCSNGRNLGIESTRGDTIAFTDDDCRVAPDWATRLLTAFERDAEAAVLCGRVSVPEAAWKDGSASSFEPKTPEWTGTFGDWGITANLGVRRRVFEAVGRFDPVLGVGGPLRSGGEPDLLFRVIRAGLRVANIPEARVEHLGVRDHGADSRRLWRSYGLGTGAAIFKHVRLGDPLGLRLWLRWLGACVAWSAGSVLRTGRPTGLGYGAAFVAGCVQSFRFRVDRRTRMYVPRAS